jgi:hypothetical protein
MHCIVLALRGGDAGILPVQTGPIDATLPRAHTVKKMEDVIRRWFHVATPGVVGSGTILFDIAAHHFAKNQLLPYVY